MTMPMDPVKSDTREMGGMSMVRLTVCIPWIDRRRLKVIATRRNTLSMIVRRAIRNYLEDAEGELIRKGLEVKMAEKRASSASPDPKNASEEPPTEPAQP